MPQLCACDNFCICRTANTNHMLLPKIVAAYDTNNAGLLTCVFKRKYISLPNSSVTDFRHDIFSQTHTAAVPFGTYTRFSFHRLYLAEKKQSQLRFLLSLFCRYGVKSLAYTPVYASFLPCIGRKIVCKKFCKPEMAKNQDFSRRKGEEILCVF